MEPTKNERGEINVGVGFVTGRRSFRKVLKTYMYRWREASADIKKRVNLHLFVAYDLDYLNTHVDDYVNIKPEVLSCLDGVSFIGQSMIEQECKELVDEGVLTQDEADLMFGKGYAGKRNIILYYALKKHMDYLIFLDDDEYPLAVTKTRHVALWSGQSVLTDHLKYLSGADMTNGYHCGYISPIPHIDFNEALTEGDFRTFIEAISNDILEWDKLKQIMDNNGVTYASTQVLMENAAFEVPETNNAKFISGSNLGINLKNIHMVKPFYNPPGARGEDTFLSTCLAGHKLMRIPSYTFHDGFSSYGYLLDGVLPLQLKPISAIDENVKARFYRACIGWIRYKPLYLYITKPQQFKEEIAGIRAKLAESVPKLSAYFDNPQFSKVISEFNYYTRQVKSHYQSFLDNQKTWDKCKTYLFRI